MTGKAPALSMCLPFSPELRLRQVSPAIVSAIKGQTRAARPEGQLWPWSVGPHSRSPQETAPQLLCVYSAAIHGSYSRPEKGEPQSRPALPCASTPGPARQLCDGPVHRQPLRWLVSPPALLHQAALEGKPGFSPFCGDKKTWIHLQQQAQRQTTLTMFADRCGDLLPEGKGSHPSSTR